DRERLRALYSLDKSVSERYVNWVTEVVGTGDFGFSRTYRVPVTELLGSRLMNTLILSSAALILALLIGLPIGILAGLKPGSRFDYTANLFAFAGISIPSFWLALMLMLVFSVWLQWLPAGRTMSIGLEAGTWEYYIDRLKHLILP